MGFCSLELKHRVESVEKYRGGKQLGRQVKWGRNINWKNN